MVGIFERMRQVLSGRILMENRTKYKFLGFCVAAVHLLFGLMMGWLHIMPLFLYNLAITGFYAYFAFVLTAKENYLAIYISIFVEILFYAALATILLGWEWGFMLYTVGLIPASFYLSYTLPGIERRVSIPVITSLGVGVCYLCVDVIARCTTPIYSEGISPVVIAFFHYYNTILIFILLVFFSLLFALEVRYMQRLLEKENNRLGEMAHYDPLTKLLNRRSMDECLRKIFDRAVAERPFCLMMADIDDFKQVNDTYGHDLGDRVLKTVSETISKCVRETDRVCRWGGEEFLVLFQIDLEHAGQIAERIRNSIESNVIQAEGVEIRVTMTMGIAQYHSDATIHSMVNAADEKLYYGKKHGKNQVVI